jgi:hypothetical protein
MFPCIFAAAPMVAEQDLGTCSNNESGIDLEDELLRWVAASVQCEIAR